MIKSLIYYAYFFILQTRIHMFLLPDLANIASIYLVLSIFYSELHMNGIGQKLYL
jgi:hypothetical protein